MSRDERKDTLDDLQGNFCTAAPDGGGCAYEYIPGNAWCGQPPDFYLHDRPDKAGSAGSRFHDFVPVKRTVATLREREKAHSKEIEEQVRPVMVRAADGNLGPQFDAMVKEMVRIINNREACAYSKGFNHEKSE